MRGDEIAARVLVAVLGGVCKDWRSTVPLQKQPSFHHSGNCKEVACLSLQRLSFSEHINLLARLHRHKTTTISGLYVHSPSKQMQVEQEQGSVRLQRLSLPTSFDSRITDAQLNYVFNNCVHHLVSLRKPGKTSTVGQHPMNLI